jgi:protein tyrosine/serine phosphatase
VLLVGIFSASLFLSAPPTSALDCGGVDTSVIGGDACEGASTTSSDSSTNPVISVLKFVMQVLMGAVGIAAVGALIYAGIMYSSAGGESSQVQKAKTVIKDTVIGIVAFSFMIIILNFVIPGGVFGQQGVTGGGTSAIEIDDDDDPIQTSNSTTFSIVSMPDTQFEINEEAKTGAKKVFNSMQWIVNNKAESKSNIQVVVGPGDLTNAGDPTDSKVKKMFATVSKDYAILDAANIPYSISNGNHDTDATCTDAGKSYGARNCTSNKDTYTKNLHQATMFNKTFTTSRAGLKGLTLYKTGEVQNSYRVFRVHNTNWLVLSIEFYPRAAVFKWAQKVVASHPTYNVVVVTHGYMGNGTNVIGKGISNYCAKGGDCTEPETIQSDLLLKYSNVKMLFSGHVTTWSTRIDTAKSSGNKVVQFKSTVHACVGGVKCTNPMRIVKIDLEKNTLTSQLCLTATPTTLSDCESKTINGMKYVTSGSSGTANPTTPAISVAGVENFRDAGTLNSTVLKTGLLYRSANLNSLTATGKKTLTTLLKGGTILDLRTTSDSGFKKDPTITGATNTNIQIKGEGTSEGYKKTFVNNATARGQFAKTINAIADTTGPVLVHCKHGKDRTGWTIAMIMYIVGDGKYSNSQLDTMVLKEYELTEGSSGSILSDALTEAKTKYGSIMNYIRKGLGISEDTITKLKNRLGV